MKENFQKILLAELGIYFRPLLELENDPEKILEVFKEMGWDLWGLEDGEKQGIVDHFGSIISSIAVLNELIDNPPEGLLELLPALDRLTPLYNTIESLPEFFSSIDVSGISELPTDVLNSLTLNYLLNRFPFAFSFLELLTIIQRGEEKLTQKDGILLRHEIAFPELHLSRLFDLILNPIKTFKDEYWPNGLPDLDTSIEVARKLFPRIQACLAYLDIQSSSGNGLLEFPEDVGKQLENMFSLNKRYYQPDHDDYLEFGISFGLLPEVEGGPGLLLYPSGEVSIDSSFDSWKFQMDLQGAGGGLLITEQLMEFLSDQEAAKLKVGFSLESGQEDEEELFYLFGSTKGTRLEIGKVLINSFIGNIQDGLNYGCGLQLSSIKLVLAGGDGDGFINKIIPGDGCEIEFDLDFNFSNRHGFQFGGSGGLEIKFPQHLTIGPIDILDLGMAVTFEDRIALSAMASVVAKLGPVTATVKNLGLKSSFGFPSSGGNLGLVDLDLGFKSPTGVGLAINASGITGGGVLNFDDTNKRYFGLLALKFGDIGLTAAALITTRMSDGSDGFSMLLNIGILFNPPIQLAMGFTLSGVGGLIGINRSMQVDELRAGIKAHTLDSILFPDPETLIPNADQIIKDLRAVFPPAEGQFVIGPMVKIGWGNNLLTADVGFFIEFPDPVRVVMLGQVEVMIPDKKDPIISIHLDLIGVIDVPRQEITFQASMYDSFILAFEMFGDAAFLLGWGDSPRFALAIGGFHPKFAPPPPPVVFSGLKRMTVSISYGDLIHFSCASYQAITSNTLQFGARVDLYVNIGPLSVDGYLGFDALFVFSPFSFDVGMSGGVHLKFKGINLLGIDIYLKLSGPTPWHARGTATICLLFIPIEVGFNETWGREEKSTLDPIDPWPLLMQALEAPENWGSFLPKCREMAVMLRDIQAKTESNTEFPLLVHPAGILEVRQQICPLDPTWQLEKFVNAPITEHDQFWIEALQVGDEVIPGGSSVMEFFAPGQYTELEEEKVWTTAAFRRFPAGIRASAEQEVDIMEPEDKDNSVLLEYAPILIDAEGKFEPQETTALVTPRMSQRLRQRTIRRAGAMQSGTRAVSGAQYRPVVPVTPRRGTTSTITEEGEKIVFLRKRTRARVKDLRYRIVQKDTLTPSEPFERSLSRTAAEQQLKKRPDDHLIVHEFELAL